MSGSYLDSIPSPVARNKIDIFDSDTSEETFDSGSDDFHHVHRSISDEHLALPPRLSSTFDRTKGVEPITYSESFMKDDPNFKSESKTLNSVELNAWEKWLVKKLEAEQKSLRKKTLERQKQQEEEIKRKEEKEIRTKIAQERHTKWAEEKLSKLKIRNAVKQREEKVKRELEEAEKEKQRIKAEQNFEKWIEKQNEICRRKRKEEKEKKEEERKMKEEKQQRNEEHFNLWLQKNKSRFEAMRKTGPPMPSYVNPNPWVACNQDETRRRPNTTPAQALRLQSRTHASLAAGAKPRTLPRKSSRPETHTPMRMGPNHSRVRPQSGLVRTQTPLRFAGIRPRTISRNADPKIAPPVPLQASTPTRSGRKGSESKARTRNTLRRPI